MRLNLFVIGVSAVLSCATGAACADKAQHEREGAHHRPPMEIEEALKTHTDELMSLPGVTGTAQGLCEGQPCVKVFVIEKTPDLEQAIHAILKGVPLLVEETGRIRARPKSQDP